MTATEALASSRLTMIVPGDPDQRTGGYLYDAHIVSELRAMGWSVDVIGLAGEFPAADDRARQAMATALSRLPDGERVVIDGLALGGVPEPVQAHAERLVLTGLIHHPLADETGLSAEQQQALLASERAAIAHCRGLIVTSRFTRKRLQALGMDLRPVSVAEPGVAPAALARRVDQRLQNDEPNGPARLLCVASLSPRKAQDVLIDALADLRDRDWSLRLVGSPDRSPDFARRLREQINQRGLESRVQLSGEVSSAELDEHYHEADLCLLPSWYEGYGMVVSEALARGLPLITSTGGALAETVPADAALRVPPGDRQALRDALARWLDEPDLRMTLSRAAAGHRSRQLDWPTAARRFAEALKST